MENEKLILNYISNMEIVDKMSFEDYKKRNIVLNKGFSLLKKITGSPIDYQSIYKILDLSNSNNVILGIAGLIRFDNEELSKQLYNKLLDKDPIVSLILKNWEKDNQEHKKLNNYE